MTIATTSWLTRPEAKRHVGLNLSQLGDTDKNLLIDDLINQACGAVVRELGRGVVKTTYTEYYDPLNVDSLLLYNPPADVISVYEDGTRTFDSTTLLTKNTDYLVPDYKSGEGQGAGLGRKIIRLNSNWTKGYQTVMVVYFGGWTYTVDNTNEDAPTVSADNIPGSIRKAALLTVQRLWDVSGTPGGNMMGRTGMSGQQVGSVSAVARTGDADLTAAVPAEAMALLKEYRWRVRDEKY